MAAGPLRQRISFQREVVVPDGAGGGSSSWQTFVTVWGGLKPQRGRAAIDGGRLAEAIAGILTVRSSAETRAVTSANRALIDDVPYQIHGITNPDRRNRYLEMTVERGVAT